MKLQDLTGKRFGRLVVIGRAPSLNKRTRWHVRCDCGTEKTVGAHGLTCPVERSRIVSCGCYGKGDSAQVVAYTPDIASTLTRGAEPSDKGSYSGRRQEDDSNMVAYALQAGVVRQNPNNGPDGVGGQEGIAYTLEARSEVQLAQHGNWAVRRLMPIECERLQGFPDNFTLVPRGNRLAADGPRYKAIGNSMAVNAMRWIGRRIDFIETEYRHLP